MSKPRVEVSALNDDSKAVAGCVALLLVFAPLLKGGNDPLPLLILELSSLLVWGRILMHPSFRHSLSRTFQSTLFLFFLLPLIYLIPVPIGLWGELPGRNWYLELMAFAQGEPILSGFRQVSLTPFLTEFGWYTAFFPMTIFLITVGMSRQKLKFLVYVFLAMAVFQALLGLLQYGQGPDSVLRFGNPFYSHSAVGTYANRNHLAGLLCLALPLSLALLVNSLGRGQGEWDLGSRHSHRRRKLAALDSSRLAQGLFFGALAITLLIGLIFSRSRGGIGLGVFGLVLAILMFVPRLGKKTALAVLGTILMTIVGLSAAIGLGPVWGRFISMNNIGNSRWEIFSAAFEGARVFLPLGSGLSSFPEVFSRFQPLDMQGFVNRAHNDYLELFFDAGWLLVLPVTILILQYVLRWGKVVRGGTWGEFNTLQAAAGLSVLLMLLHSLLDFNLHIPANMGYFAFLSGVFFHAPSRPESQHSHGATGRRELGREKVPSSSVKKREIPPENLVNPFSDMSSKQ